MMLKAFRVLVLAVLALAVPLQGVAAVTAGQCMALEHHEDGHGGGHDDGQDASTHSHGDEHQANQAGEEQQSSHCGPCTACCASASIAGPVALLIQSSPSDTQYLFSQFPPLGVEPHGLDRPPLAL
jgi:hypothetical protein